MNSAPEPDTAELPEKWHDFTALNAEHTKTWPVIDEKKDELPTAEDFKEVVDKRELFDPASGG